MLLLLLLLSGKKSWAQAFKIDLVLKSRWFNLSSGLSGTVEHSTHHNLEVMGSNHAGLSFISDYIWPPKMDNRTNSPLAFSRNSILSDEMVV